MNRSWIPDVLMALAIILCCIGSNIDHKRLSTVVSDVDALRLDLLRAQKEITNLREHPPVVCYAFNDGKVYAFPCDTPPPTGVEVK